MFRLINKLKNRKGFTLIELIVVLAVLAIIMAIAVPRFIGVQTKSKEQADAATLEMIAKASELYYVQRNDDTPTIEELVASKDIEPGLKFQVDDETIDDDSVTITIDTATSTATVTRK